MEPTTSAFDTDAIAAQISDLTTTVGTLGTAVIGVVLGIAAFVLVISLVRKSKG